MSDYKKYPSMSFACLTGTLGRDPEFKKTPSDLSILAFSIAVNTQPGKEIVTTWWNCTLFGKQAEGGQKILVKGMKINVVGVPWIKVWERNGNKGTSAELTVKEFFPISWPKKDPASLPPEKGKELEANNGPETEPEPEQGSFPGVQVAF